MLLTRSAMVAGGALCGSAAAQCINFEEVTTLAEGALVGDGIDSPVPGFELLFMVDGEVVYQRAFGTWHVGRVGNTDSATKTLAGALIVSLTAESPQPFSLDTRLSEYIPQFSGNKSGITIRQCFAHCSGLRANNANASTTLTLQQAALSIAALPLLYTPDSAFSYGGTSMHAAGAVAELASGQSWNAAFAARILNPLGLTRTRFVLSSPTNPRIAGGCESNALEFGTVMEMLRKGGVHDGVRVMPAEAVEDMFTRQSPVGVPVINSPILGEGSDYGVGVWLDDRDSDGELTGAIAAGARGFASWIDFDDGMVGVFATDLSASGNVQPLLYALRAAAERALRARCNGDADCDLDTDSDDVAAFFAQFEAGDGDVDRDGDTDSDDVAVFFGAWEGGC